jgi:hypothetical protein
MSQRDKMDREAIKAAVEQMANPKANPDEIIRTKAQKDVLWAVSAMRASMGTFSPDATAADELTLARMFLDRLCHMERIVMEYGPNRSK